jgi:broad specificity phosphatase PhoE
MKEGLAGITVARPRRNCTGFFFHFKDCFNPMFPYDECQELMSASRIILISHGATEAQRRTAFPLDEPLLDREMERIAELKWIPPTGARAWAGPEQRTQQTSQVLGFSATVSEELRDCGYGQWSGRTMESVQTEDPDGLLAWLTEPNASPHGGEPITALIARAGIWMEQQTAENVAVAVTHPSVVRAAIVHALRVPPAAFWRFDVSPLTMTDLRFSRTWTARCVGCPMGKAPAT